MNVVFFTSNASTGAGSLAEAIKNASPGDVIRPDESVFERGSIIEITLASTLTIGKTLTLDGGPYRVRLNAGGAFRCVMASSGDGVKFAAFDFVNGAPSAGDGGCVSASVPLTLERCGVYGGVGDYGGGVFARSTLTLNDCVVTGCRAKTSGGGVASLNGLTLRGTTIVGNVSANANSDAVRHEGGDLSATNSIVGPVRATGGGALSYPGSVVDVASSQIGFVVAPPDDFSVDNWTANAWQNWDLRLLDDASGAPSHYRDSGDVDEMTQYDFQGNFRGREANGVATCSPGAFETLQADLFWVGFNASGAEVVLPSFLSSNGWAESRFSVVSSGITPQAEQTLFVGRNVSFSDAPSSFISLITGGYIVVSTGYNESGNIELSIGFGSEFIVSTSVTLRRVGDVSVLSWLSGSLTIDSDVGIDNLTVPANAVLNIKGALAKVGSLVLSSGSLVNFSGVNAVLTATQSATVGAATFTGVGYFATPPGTNVSAAMFIGTVLDCDYGAEVSSFNITPITSSSATLSWVKQNQTPSVLIEKINGNIWHVINDRAVGDSLVVDTNASKIFKLFDGENFFTASARTFAPAYELAEEQTIGYLKTLITTGYLN